MINDDYIDHPTEIDFGDDILGRLDGLIIRINSIQELVIELVEWKRYEMARNAKKNESEAVATNETSIRRGDDAEADKAFRDVALD